MKKAVLAILLAMFVTSMTVLGIELKIKPAGKTWYVGPPPADFSSIQEAIDNSSVSDGDVIEVMPKVFNEPYYENVTVYKALKIRGVPLGAYPIVDGLNDKGIVFNTTAPYVEISGFTIRNGLNGIRLVGSSARVSNNTFTSNYYGIYSMSNSAIITDNTLTLNYHGVMLSNAHNNTLQVNTMFGNNFNFGVYGADVTHYIHDIASTNTVDGKPIIYWVNRYGETVPSNAGYVAIVNSDNITAEKLTTLKSNAQCILVANSTNVVVKDSVINGSFVSFNTGVKLVSTTNSIVENVTVQDASGTSILLQKSGNNTIVNNKLLTMYKSNDGIRLDDSIHNLIANNELKTKYYSDTGIELKYSNFSLIVNNLITNTTGEAGNIEGIRLDHSHNNTLIANTVSTYLQMIQPSLLSLWYSNGTMIYRNNFFSSYPNAFGGDGQSLYVKTEWDNGYEGNYWNHYEGEDNGYGGRTSKDGIGDTQVPYLLVDHYPLMKPWSTDRIFNRAGDFSRIMKLYTHSNSTIELASFVKTDPQQGPMEFTYYKGEISLWITSGDAGSISIAIPRVWLDGNFTIKINEQTIYPEITINTTYSSFSINYTEGKYLLKIIGAEVGHVIGDVDGDGDVDIYDVVMVTSNFGKKEPS